MKSRRLARLVRLRKLVEQSHAAELQSRKRSLEEAEEDLSQLLGRIEESQEKRSSSSAAEMLWRSSFEERLEEEAEEQRGEIGTRAQVVAEGEEIVRQAWQRRRLMQHLQERAEQREFDEEKSKQYREMDDMSLMRAKHGDGEGK